MYYLLVVLNTLDRCAIPLTVAVGHSYDDDNGCGVCRVNTPRLNLEDVVLKISLILHCSWKILSYFIKYNHLFYLPKKCFSFLNYLFLEYF